MALVYNGQNGTGTAYPRPMLYSRYLSDTSVRLERRRSGQDFPAWVQGIDFSGIPYPAMPPFAQRGDAGREQLLASSELRTQQLDLYRFQLDEIDAAEPVAGVDGFQRDGGSRAHRSLPARGRRPDRGRLPKIGGARLD